jgi:predicted nuclease of predicted toxin-antitoxin system
VIISKDEDFIDIALLRSDKVQVLWLRMGNCRKKALLTIFESVWSQIQERLDKGELIIEVY